MSVTRIFMRFPQFKEKVFTMSYDDGVVQDKRLIDIMKKNGLKGTFNINSGLFAAIGGQEKGRMTREECVSVYRQSGNEVAVHGEKHLSLSAVDIGMAMNDIIQDRKNLESLFGKPIRGMAYANGTNATSKMVAEMMENCGIRYARTTESTHSFDIPATQDEWLLLPATCHHNDKMLFELAKDFLETPPVSYYWRQCAKMFYLWGHSYEFDNDNNWDVIERFAEYIGNREDVWYATNMEIYQYIRAYDSLEWAIGCNTVYNPSAIDVYLDFYGEKVLAKAGKITNLAME